MELLPTELQQEIARNLSPESVKALRATATRLEQTAILAAPGPLQRVYFTPELRRETTEYIDQWFRTNLLPSSQRTAFIDALGRWGEFRRATSSRERKTLVYRLATVWADVVADYWRAPTLDATMERAWQPDDNEARARRMILSVQQANRGERAVLYPFRVDLAGRSPPSVADVDARRPFRLWILDDYDLYEGWVSAGERRIGPYAMNWADETTTFLQNPLGAEYDMAPVEPPDDAPEVQQPRRLTESERTIWVMTALYRQDLIGITIGDNLMGGQVRLVDPVLTVARLAESLQQRDRVAGDELDVLSRESTEPFRQTQDFNFYNAFLERYYWLPYDEFEDEPAAHYAPEQMARIPYPSLANGVGSLMVLSSAATYRQRLDRLVDAFADIYDAMRDVGFP